MTISAKQIIQEVADKHEIAPETIRGESRAWYASYARHEAMHRMRTETKLGKKSLPWIGEQLNGRHHATILYGLKQYLERASNREQHKGAG